MGWGEIVFTVIGLFFLLTPVVIYVLENVFRVGSLDKPPKTPKKKAR